MAAVNVSTQADHVCARFEQRWRLRRYNGIINYKFQTITDCS